jgi:hypothetical protein
MRARVCCFIHKRIKTASWHHEAHTRDYQTIRIQYYRGGEARTLTIHNIYNQAGTGTLQRLRDQLTAAATISTANGTPDDHIIVGDINLHHPIWGGPHAATEEEAEDFIQDMDEAGMELLMEPGTVTWQREEQESTIDLTLISRNLTERLIQCAVAEELEHGSDHLPIRTIIDITTTAAEQPRRRNFKLMDHKELLGFVQANLGAPPNQINNSLQIENATDHLIETINQGIAASTPWAKPCEFSNPDFTPECREAVHNTRRLRRTYKATREPADWERYSEARNHKKQTVS